MLWIIVAALLLLWLGGFALNVVGGFIHILLVLAVAMALASLLRGTGRRGTV